MIQAYYHLMTLPKAMDGNFHLMLHALQHMNTTVPSWLHTFKIKQFRNMVKSLNHVITMYSMDTPDELECALEQYHALKKLIDIIPWHCPEMHDDGMYKYLKDSGLTAMKHKMSEMYHTHADSEIKRTVLTMYIGAFAELPYDDDEQLLQLHKDKLLKPSDWLQLKEHHHIVHYSLLTSHNVMRYMPILDAMHYCLKYPVPVKVVNAWLESLHNIHPSVYATHNVDDTLALTDQEWSVIERFAGYIQEKPISIEALQAARRLLLWLSQA